MTISKFIKTDKVLSRLDFVTVFQVLFYLYDNGLLNKEVLEDA